MLQRLRQISISSSLRGAFLTGALLTLIVSSVSLYSWHEQNYNMSAHNVYYVKFSSSFI